MNYYYHQIDKLLFTDKKNIFEHFNNDFNNKLFNKSNLDLDKNRKNTIIILCIFSSLIYSYNNLEIYKLFDQWNVKNPNIIEIINSNTVYGTFLLEDSLIISFKGTSSFINTLSDLDFSEIKESHNIPGNVHKGFNELILENDLCDNILESILNIMDSINVNTIYLTAHSLGSAIASIFYAFLKNKLTCKIKLVTFGCPKIGDRKFTNFISNEENIRVVNGNDLVTKIPRSIYWLLSYTHPKQTLLKIGKKDTYLFSIDDHNLDNYYTAIINATNI